MNRNPFGAEMRREHFSFAPEYRPLNHGSFGAFPKAVLDHQRELQDQCEASPDTFIRIKYPKLLQQSRAALASLLGADPREVVLAPNSTTAVNTVLRNINFQENDVIIYFKPIYGTCLRMIESIADSSPVYPHEIRILYPIDDDTIEQRFRHAVMAIRSQNRRPKLAMFDTVVQFPGVLFPWEKIANTCKELNVISLVDAAHGVGHIDMTHLAKVGPDFTVLNCHKWLMVPRGCAALYVPFRNQSTIISPVPVSKGYLGPEGRSKLPVNEYFIQLFNMVGTIDTTIYCCIPAALKFRADVCGGEAKIRQYCERISSQGGKRMAEIMGTEVLGDDSCTFRRCCFVNVRLPLTLSDLGVGMAVNDGIMAAKWMEELTPLEYETFIPIKYYGGEFLTRISGQIYLTVEDFEWAARTLVEICARVKLGEWK